MMHVDFVMVYAADMIRTQWHIAVGTVGVLIHTLTNIWICQPIAVATRATHIPKVQICCHWPQLCTL